MTGKVNKEIQEPTPAERLVRLKAVVKHLADTWPAVLQRQTYMQAMGRSEDLRDALHSTYASHVHNTVQGVLLIDLIREIGALVLDESPQSASVASAMAALRSEVLLEELRSEYRIVPPLTRTYNDDELTDNMREVVAEMWQRAELERNLNEFDSLCSKLTKIDAEVMKAEIRPRLWKARSKAIAHYDLVQDGGDWRMWRIGDGDTTLTYGEVDRYIDACTAAIETLYLLVRRAWFDMNETRRIAQKYADEYIGALVLGLRQQREKHEKERAQGGARIPRH